MPARCTDARDLDAAVEVLGNHKTEWARLPVARRIALLRACLAGYMSVAADVAAAGCEAKGLDPRSPAAGEEWMSGPVPVMRQLRLFIESLQDIERAGRPALSDRSIHRVGTGELAATVFPRDLLERVMYPGARIDVWMQPDVGETGLRDSMASAYRRGRPDGGVTLVLGAGNVASIAPTDVLYKLLVDHQVVVLKMHPVNDYVGPLLERAFRPLVDAGYLRIVYGDARQGQYLVHHRGVDDVHMTGSTTVHDRIVWGETPEEQARRRAAAAPTITKRITSELGCVTPIIVVPGTWSDAELQYHAENVATMVVHSASCTCTTARVLVTWRGWPQRLAFLDRVAAVLARQPPRRAYYPGSIAKYDAFARSHLQARFLCDAPPLTLGPAVVYDVDPSLASDLAFREEAWSPVLAETALGAEEEAAFVAAAVPFCNERVFGTLSVVLLVDPRFEARHQRTIDRAVADLRYGTVAVNHWSALSFGLGVPPWGAYPGHTLDDVGSGIGFVHNTLMFDRPLKTVLRAPFVVRPKPAWFVTHRRAHIVGRRMAAFEASPSMWRLPGIAVPALRT